MQNIFGPDVRTIVEGETKFSKIGVFNSETVSKGDVKARDLQHLFLAMTKEVSRLCYHGLPDNMRMRLFEQRNYKTKMFKRVTAGLQD